MADIELQADALAESRVADVIDEITDRINRGEDLDVEAYVARYPNIAAIVRRVCETLCLLRQSAAGHRASSQPATRPMAVVDYLPGNKGMQLNEGR